jgi:hypothetical protein
MNAAAKVVVPSRCRAGVSILEFLGCTSALVGGVVLGSMYLGVDVKEMAFVALERANLVEPRPDVEEGEATASAETPTDGTATAEGATTAAESTDAGSSPVTPESTAEAAPAAAETSGASDARSTTGSKQPAADVPTASPPAQSTGFFAREDLITDEQRKVLTLAYWEALDLCMEEEVETRVPAIDRDGTWQLFDYLTGRKAGHQKAAEAIAALDARGVDDHVMAYAKKARAWHDDGAKLFGRAVDLLTDAPTAQLSGPFAQSWQSAATQHKMEARLLAEKHAAVKTYLSHAYEEGATAGQPAAAGSP